MDDSDSQVQVLQFLSECLKLFRQKMMHLMKMSQMASSQKNNQLQKTCEEGEKLLEGFSKLNIENVKLQQVLARFASRVKQIVSNTRLKYTTIELSNYLNFLTVLLKQSVLKDKLHFLLKQMLVRNPQGTTLSNVPQQKYQKYFDSQKIIQSQIHSIQNSIKIQGYYDSYQNFISVLEKEYKLLEGINLDENQYRKKFFLARQDNHRSDTNLFDDMMIRNRFSQQMLVNYQHGFERYCKKLQLRKNKKQQGKRETGDFLKTQITSFTTKESNLKTHQSFGIKIPSAMLKNNIIKKIPQKIKTQHYSKIQFSAKEIDQAKKCEDEKNNSFHIHRKKVKANFVTCPSSQQFFQDSNGGEKQKSGKPMGKLMELKKINFLGSKIQLMPQNHQTRDMRRIDRRKNLCKRTQEHFNKKISIISHPKPDKNSEANRKMSRSKPKIFTPLMIDYSRLQK